MPITSPDSPCSLVVVVRDEEAARQHKRAAMAASVKDIRATCVARSSALMQVEHSANRSLVRDYLDYGRAPRTLLPAQTAFQSKRFKPKRSRFDGKCPTGEHFRRYLPDNVPSQKRRCARNPGWLTLSSTLSPASASAGMPTSLWKNRPRRYSRAQAAFTVCS